MPAVNGVTPPASPQPDATAPPTKRKHDDISSDALVNGENTANDRNNKIHIQPSVRDIWEALNTHDPSKPLLTRLASYKPANSTSEEPSTKRPKLSSSLHDDTIASKVANGHYESYEAFVTDVEQACSGLLESEQPETDAANGSSLGYEHLTASVATIKNILANLVYHEMKRTKSTTVSAPKVAKLEHEDEVKADGVNHVDVPAAPILAPSQPSRAVLTLFGNAQGPKQLFSSLQKPVSNANAAQLLDGMGIDIRPGSFVPLREGGLPLGIAGTRIVGAPKQDVSKTVKPRRTLQDVFPTPASVRSLAPPKTPKLTISRESAITWSKGPAPEQTSRSTGYPNERLSTGAWLGYGGVAPAEESASPQAKRKQRDRALSIGDSGLTQSRVAKAALLQAQEEALFRSAYSSFAPSRDNSTALIPDKTRDEMWWEKYGSHYMSQTFALDPALESQPEQNTAEAPSEDKESLFQQAVEQFDPPTPPTAEEAGESEDKDAQEILVEVSQMLETLHSYQRIRMSSLSGASKTSLVQHSPLQEFTGSPAAPSAAEVETYKTLKSQLALIISMLPPYTVAKLNGDQLADLNISQEIPIEVEEYRGVMEEDKASRDARQAAFQAAVGASAATGRPSPMQPNAQNHLRTAQMSQPARGHNPNQLQYNNTPQTMPRAQPQFSRQPLSSWQKPNQNNTASIQRPAYANAQNFTPQPMHRNPNSIPRQQQPYTPMQQPPRPPGLTQLPNGISQSAPHVPYQQRMHGQGSPTYNSTNSGLGLSPSPSKNIPRPYQPQMQPTPAQQQVTSQMSPSQASPSQASPDRQQPALQLGISTQNSTQPLPQPQPQLAAPALPGSPLPRPSSVTGLGIASGSGDTDGAAVTSRSETPSTPVPPQATPQQHIPPVANMTPITQE